MKDPIEAVKEILENETEFDGGFIIPDNADELACQIVQALKPDWTPLIPSSAREGDLLIACIEQPDEELLLKDEELGNIYNELSALDWEGLLKVFGEIAKAQLAHSMPIIEARERERIAKIVKQTELPMGTTGNSIQEACRRTILREVNK